MTNSRRAWARIMADPRRDAFMHDAACRGEDVNIFFDLGHGNSIDTKAAIALARSVCARCPVVDACRDYAIAVEADGIWGGLTYDERRRLVPAQ